MCMLISAGQYTGIYHYTVHDINQYRYHEWVMIEIAQKMHGIPNRTHTKCTLKSTLMLFNFDQKPASVSFSVV